jgi:hypothetical protein
MVLLGRHLLFIPSVLDVDVDPPVGVLFDERLGSPERLGALGEYGGPAVLMFDRPLVACVLISEDVVTVSVFHISSQLRQAECYPRWVLGMDTKYPTLRNLTFSGAR